MDPGNPAPKAQDMSQQYDYNSASEHLGVVKRFAANPADRSPDPLRQAQPNARYPVAVRGGAVARSRDTAWVAVRPESPPRQVAEYRSS